MPRLWRSRKQPRRFGKLPPPAGSPANRFTPAWNRFVGQVNSFGLAMNALTRFPNRLSLVMNRFVREGNRFVAGQNRLPNFTNRLSWATNRFVNAVNQFINEGNRFGSEANWLPNLGTFGKDLAFFATFNGNCH